MNSLAYEADARVKDPVYGCVGAISVLQRQIAQLQQELAIAHSDLARFSGGAGMMAGPSTMQGHAGNPSPSLGIGMGLTLPSGQPGGREQMISAREQQTRLARDAHLLELQRDTQLTREQLIEQFTRAGGGSLEAGLAAFGMAGSMAPLGSTFPPRSASEGGSGSSGGGTNMSHLSPP